MNKEIMKEKGITLVALVITIIILLILVGVTLKASIGTDGLVERTKESVERYKNTSEDEQYKLQLMENKIGEIHEVINSNPVASIVITGDNKQESSPKIEATIKHEYNKGININQCKWVLNNSEDKLGTDENKYENTFTSNPETIDLSLSEGSNYIHILTITSNNKKVETVSKKVEVTAKYHEHTDECYNNIYHTHTDTCYQQDTCSVTMYVHHTTNNITKWCSNCKADVEHLVHPYWAKHSKCGAADSAVSDEHVCRVCRRSTGKPSNYTHTFSTNVLICEKDETTVDSQELICEKEEGSTFEYWSISY